MNTSNNYDTGYLLLVEDEPAVQSNNMKILRRRGYNIKQAYTLTEARDYIAESPPRGIILDIQLPDGSGLDFLSELREESDIPVLILTAMGAREDIIRGFQTGSDDYLTKPYDFGELLARVEALIRRAGRVPDVISKGRLTLDVTANIATLEGTDLLLTQKEFAVLLIFVQNEEHFISAKYLYDKVWKAPIPNNNDAVKSVIKRLRAKITGSGWQITWSRGEGYAFEHE